MSGKELEMFDTLIIAVSGFSVVMIELALLALFVTIMSKVLAPFAGNGKKVAVQAAAPAPAAPAVPAAPAPAPSPAPAPVAQPQSFSDFSDVDDEIAAVMAAVIEESGLSPEEIIFKSIDQR